MPKRHVLFGFALSVLFVPGISGAATAPRWALAAVVLPLLVPTKRVNFTAAHLCGLLFLWYAALSVTWSANAPDAADSFIKLVVLAEAFWLGSKLDSIKHIVIGFGLGMWINSALLGVDLPTTSDHPAGLFVNSNALGEIAALTLVAAVAYRVWWLVPGILPAVVVSQCRGAWLAVAGVVLLWIWDRSRLAAVALGALGVGGVVWFGSSESIQLRLAMWGATAHQLTFFGHGIGSFYTLFPLYSPFDTLLQRPDHLHNDWLEFTFELGAIGTGLYLAFLWFARSAVVAAFVIEAVFGFPTHMAATVVMVGICAGYAVRDGADVRRVFADWRDRVRGRFANVLDSIEHCELARGGCYFSAQGRLPEGECAAAG